MRVAEMIAAVRASSVAELTWVGPDPMPSVLGVVALVRGDRPAIAFTYAHESLARQIARAPSVALSFTERRSTGSAFRPVLVHGRPSLLEDPTGAVFTDEMLDEELRRYPPARVYADSPLLRREHWWYLPRLILEIDVETVSPLPPRDSSRDHLLAVVGTDRVDVRTARVDDPSSTSHRLTLQVSGDLPPSGRAVLFGQDVSLPDMEVWSQWSFEGSWDGVGIDISRAPERVGLGRTPSVWQRWRRQRELERRCQRALSAG